MRTNQLLAKMIGHSPLPAAMAGRGILEGYQLAAKYVTATVCVKSYSVELAPPALMGSDVGICAVSGFPHGNSTSAIKVAETREAIGDGAAEIDMVINIGKALSGEWAYISSEIEAINEAVASADAILKVVLRPISCKPPMSFGCATSARAFGSRLSRYRRATDLPDSRMASTATRALPTTTSA
jgi:deoxyribose-phosphate aldolase